MPDFFDVVRSQRGVSRFKPDPVPAATLQQILEAATRAPSGSNRQQWRFMVVEERELKARLGELYLEADRRSRESAPPAPPAGDPLLFTHGMADVPVVILPCVEKWRIQGREVYRGASIYPAVQNLMLAAAAHGLGTRLTTRWQYCYQEVAELLGVPDDWDIMALIPLGYPAAPDHLGGSRRKPVPEIAFRNAWGEAWTAL